MRILNVYKWATVGGVERVILSRAVAFRKHGLNIRQDVFFFHDSGGLNYIRRFIRHYHLEDYIAVVSNLEEKLYDLIFTFDTPEVFSQIKDVSRIIVECHSPYDESRVYLKALPENIARIVSPSESFMRSVVLREIPRVFYERISILPNFHINSAYEDAAPIRIWGKKPVCYVGRMDSLKNTRELLDIFAAMRGGTGDDHILLLVGDARPHYMDIKEIVRKLRIEDRVAYFRPIPFEKVDALFAAVKQHNGIFVSPSKGESFGLSALEAMSSGVPVLLTDIECHKALVNDDPAFLYKQGNVAEAVKKAMNAFRGYDDLAAESKRLASRYNSESFIKAWEKICADL